jgi:uncharacterized metal-binding protein YceD (DUF177 family)
MLMAAKRNDRDTGRKKELEWPVNVAVLPSSGFRLKLEPDDAERSRLAATAGIPSVDSMVAELVFTRWRKNGVEVRGRIDADVTQECVVTLEPVAGKVEEEIDRIFLPEGSKLAKPRLSDDGELLLDPDGRDAPEIFTGETLDAWEIVIEHFLLGLDPFPRAEGAGELEWSTEAGENAEKDQENPFSVLARLRNGENEEK